MDEINITNLIDALYCFLQLIVLKYILNAIILFGDEF